MSQSVLAIGEFSVRQIDGLFSLNDLHAASGGEAKHSPNRFMRLDQTQALIAEIGQTPEMALAMKAQHGGANPGTYACRELVIAYAAWISAAFHLKVIRVFLSAQVAPVAPALPAPSLKNRRWLISFDHTGAEVVQPVPTDAFVLTVPELCAAVLSGEITGRDFIELAYAVNQHQFHVAVGNKNRGYGEEVASKLTGMSWSDLHIINQRASMEVWMRSQIPQKAAA